MNLSCRSPFRPRTKQSFQALCCLAGLLFAAPLFAQTLQEEIETCAQFSNDTKRLQCFDKLAGGLKQHAEKQFGQEMQAATEDAPESITATIAEVREAAYGKYIFVLDNGQVWRQTGTSRVIWKGGEQVELERGFLGAFYMRKTSGGRSVKVSRVQ